MKKKQIIKEQKKLKEQQKEVATLFKDDKEVYNVFKIAIGVLLFIGLAYLAMNAFKGDLLTKSNKKETEIDSKMLIAGTMFNKEENEYLVLAYNMKDKKETFYAALTNNYSGTSHLYYLDLASGFNDSIIGDKTEVSNDLTKLKLSGPTLLVIKGNNITKSYIGEEEIVKYFSQK